jgi:LuxR family transcriptional regulator, activator of conjugal transfer of Ti plasmids
LNQWLERLTEQVSLAQCETAVHRALEKITREAGFDRYAYLSLQADTQIAISNYPAEWQRRYFEKSYVEIDPVIRHAQGRQQSFNWSNMPTGRPDRKQTVFFGEAREFGLQSGVTIPFKSGFGRWAMLTFACDEPEFATSKDVDPVTAAIAAATLHAKLSFVQARPTGTTIIQLKAQELTCLRWSAEGKTMKDIATLENISYSTVTFHIRNAKTALGVYSLQHATALATQLGII